MYRRRASPLHAARATTAALSEEILAERFAVAIEQGRGVPLPVRPGRP